MVDVDRTVVLRNCIEALPADQREVLILLEFEEMSYKQIAETANLPVGTVMSRLARARQRLEECVSTGIGERQNELHIFAGIVGSVFGRRTGCRSAG